MLAVNLAASFTLEAEVTVIVIWVVIGLGFAVCARIDGDRASSLMYLTASVFSALLGVVASDPFAAYAGTSMLYAGLLAGSAVQVYSRSQDG